MKSKHHNDLWKEHELDSDKRDRKKIVLKESGCRYIGNNRGQKVFYTYKVDRGIISTNAPKCDYLLINDDYRNTYFIELKGQNLNRAIIQLKETINNLIIKKNLKNFKFNLRVVSSNIPRIITEEFKVFRKEIMKLNKENTLELMRSGKEEEL